MEKFTRWEDKSCGINPFVPTRLRVGWAAWALGAGLALARLALLAPLVVAVVALGALDEAGGRWARALTRAALQPLCRLVLLVAGFLRIEERVPDARRLRLGKLSGKGLADSARARDSFGATVGSGDILLVNHAAPVVEVLYLFARFGCDFGLVELPAGRTVRRAGLLGALRRAAWPGGAEASSGAEAGESLAAAAARAGSASGAPLAVFPEGVPSNGKAVLRWLPACVEALGAPGGGVHIVAVDFGPSAFLADPTAASLVWYLALLSSQASHAMAVNLVPGELRTAQLEPRSGAAPADEPAPAADAPEQLRALMAACVGPRGVKTVALGPEEYVSFLAYFSQSASEAAAAAKRTS